MDNRSNEYESDIFEIEKIITYRTAGQFTHSAIERQDKYYATDPKKDTYLSDLYGKGGETTEELKNIRISAFLDKYIKLVEIYSGWVLAKKRFILD